MKCFLKPIGALVMLIFVFFWNIEAVGSDLFTISHYSPSLEKQTHFNVLCPPAIDPDTEYPVLYLLHGAYGSYVDWAKSTNIETYADDYRIFIVMPDGGSFGWYVDSPVDATSAYETYIAEELIETVDSLFPTVENRTGRGICGLSMGGHGALSLAAKRPQVFSSASSLSGILRLTSHPDKWHIVARLGPFESNPSLWGENCVYDLIPRFADSDIEILFDVGLEDQTGAVKDNQECDKRFTELAVPHIYREFPGAHSWKYWDTHIREHLDFHTDNFSSRLGRIFSATAEKEREALDKWHQHYLNRLETFREENARLKRLFPDRKTIVLLGSSSVEHFDESELMPGYFVLDRGISADRIGLTDRGILHRLQESVFDCNPAHVFILNGRNDLGQTMREGSPTVQEVAQCYRKVVQAIIETLPDVQVHIVSCSPTRNRYEPMASLVREYDEQLKVIADDFGLDYLDVYSRLVGQDGLLKPEYSMPDGLHISAPAYKIWADMMIESLHTVRRGTSQ